MAAKKASRAIRRMRSGLFSPLPSPLLTLSFSSCSPCCSTPFFAEEPGAYNIHPRRGVCNKRFNCMLFFNGSFRKSVYVAEHFYCFQVFREPFTKPALDCFPWKRYDCEGLDSTRNRWLWKLFSFSVIFLVKVAVFYLKEMLITLAN